MKAMRKFVCLGLPVLLAAVSVPTFAQSNDEDGGEAAVATAQTDPPFSSDAKRDPTIYVQHRLARLKSKLGITAEQEPQWSAFTGTVMQQMEQFRAKHQIGRTPGPRRSE